MPKFKAGDKISINGSPTIYEIISYDNQTHFYQVRDRLGVFLIDENYIDTNGIITATVAPVSPPNNPPVTSKPATQHDKYVGTKRKFIRDFYPSKKGDIIQITSGSSASGYIKYYYKYNKLGYVLYHDELNTYTEEYIDDKPSRFAASECTCDSRDLFNKGCRCGCIKPFKPKWR